MFKSKQDVSPEGVIKDHQKETLTISIDGNKLSLWSERKT